MVQEATHQPEGVIELHAPELYAAEVETAGADGFEKVSEEEIALYRERGWLVVHNAYTQQEVEAARQGLLYLIAGGNPKFTRIEPETAASELWPSLSAEQRLDAVRKLMNFADFDERLKAMTEKRALLALLARLLGGVPRLYQDMALLKPPKWGREKPWHQDHAYFDLPLDTKVAGVWIALDEATVENGCMHVLSGAHRDGPVPHFQRRDWQICDTEMLGRRSVAIPLKPGGCLIFDSLLPHGTPHNYTSDRRHAVQFHYCPANAAAIPKEERLAVFGGEGGNATC